MWEYDTISSKFFDALKAAVMRGVEVNLLIDSFGSSIDKKIIKELEDLGIHIQIFRPFKIGKVSLYAGRAHRRAFIFDSRLGYFGGSSISKKWFTKRRKDQVVYDDIMYRVTGEAVAHLESSFGELWSSYSGIILQGKRITREVDSSMSINAFSLSHIPRMDIHPITYTFWYACMCARAEIVIINPYFIPGTTLLNILCQKAKSGVRVQVITQGTSEMFFVQGACHSYYETLLACGVEIYEHTKPHLHTKVLVIDKHFTIGGSLNFDIRSQRINHELVFGVQSDTFASDNLEVLKIYQPFLKKINLDVWRKRPYIHKLFENSMHYLSEQF